LRPFVAALLRSKLRNCGFGIGDFGDAPLSACSRQLRQKYLICFAAVELNDRRKWAARDPTRPSATSIVPKLDIRTGGLYLRTSYEWHRNDGASRRPLSRRKPNIC